MEQLLNLLTSFTPSTRSLVATSDQNLPPPGERRDKFMNDNITQMRLSMRLDTYLKEYKEDNISRDALSNTNWNTAWKVANSARTQDILTPELVDDVRIALHGLAAKRL